MLVVCGFFFNDTAPTEIYTLSLHDALPICRRSPARPLLHVREVRLQPVHAFGPFAPAPLDPRHRGLERLGLETARPRSEEHTSELQSRQYLVCRLLLEKKKKHSYIS